MRKIQLEAKDQTPWVILDKENSTLEIRGYSFPDEAHAFYDDIINWFAEYAKDPNPETKLIFDLIYANSTSLKFLNDILKKMDLIVAAGKKVEIEWHYVADDEDLLQLGNILRDFHKVPFTFLPK
ncbi:MAG TPA: DUF1987 domain-containing protein [Bacteroidia bacterium]